MWTRSSALFRPTCAEARTLLLRDAAATNGHQKQQHNTYSNSAHPKGTNSLLVLSLAGASASAAALLLYKYSNWHPKQLFSHSHALSRQKVDDAAKSTSSKPLLTTRERRFVNFASLEHKGQIYMTPRDFLDSVTEEKPRSRIKRRVLNEADVSALLTKAPLRRNAGRQLFRSMDDVGIISFTEYLFLLSVLTKPKNGFRIAFNMFDRDGNQRVDRKEFLVVGRWSLIFNMENFSVRLPHYCVNFAQI